jgi:type VI secretion system protein ImpA
LRDGFQLVQGLIERYWDTLYPQPDEDGIGTRVSALGGLNGMGSEGTLIQAIRKVPLSEPGGAGPYAFWHYTLASRPAAPQNGRPATGPALTVDDVREAVKQSSAAFLGNLRDDLAAARTVFGQVSRMLDERCGEDAPPSSAIANVLEDVAAALDHLAEGTLPSAANGHAVATGVLVGEVAAPVAEPAAMFGGPLRSREDAFRQLQEVADYFRRSEPHSPLSYTLDDLIRRGRMSLPELLAELLPDQGARNMLLTAAGIRPPRQE